MMYDLHDLFSDRHLDSVPLGKFVDRLAALERFARLPSHVDGFLDTESAPEILTKRTISRQGRLTCSHEIADARKTLEGQRVSPKRNAKPRHFGETTSDH